MAPPVTPISRKRQTSPSHRRRLPSNWYIPHQDKVRQARVLRITKALIMHINPVERTISG